MGDLQKRNKVRETVADVSLHDWLRGKKEGGTDTRRGRGWGKREKNYTKNNWIIKR